MKTSKEIYEAAEQAIYDLVADGKASASFNGRSYTALDLDKLRSISDFYRSRALASGELTVEPSQEKVSVSTPVIRGGGPIC